MEETEETMRGLRQAVIEGDVSSVEKLSKKALEKEIPPLIIIEEGMTKGIQAVGKKFENGEFFLPDLIMASESMKAGLKILEPELRRRKEEIPIVGTVVIGTVEGDIHDIGKSIVAAMLQANGFRVIDLGVDVPTTRFIEKVKETKPDILGLSALLPVTMLKQQEVVEALKREKLRGKIKVLVGGAPVTLAWANQIGADGFAEDAVEAVKKALELMGSKEKR